MPTPVQLNHFFEKLNGGLEINETLKFAGVTYTDVYDYLRSAAATEQHISIAAGWCLGRYQTIGDYDKLADDALTIGLHLSQLKAEAEKRKWDADSMRIFLKAPLHFHPETAPITAGEELMQKDYPRESTVVLRREKDRYNPDYYVCTDLQNERHSCIDVIEGLDLGFNLASCFSYIWRAGRKPDQPRLDDLKKALWFLRREIKAEESK